MCNIEKSNRFYDNTLDLIIKCVNQKLQFKNNPWGELKNGKFQENRENGNGNISYTRKVKIMTFDDMKGHLVIFLF